MSSKRRSTKAPPTPRTAVRFKFGPDVRPHTIAEFKRTRGLPRIPGLHQTPGLIAERVRSFTQTVNDVVPPGTTVSVWPAIDMAVTLAHVAPEQFGPAAGAAYTVDRGANIAVAKTITRADGSGFDIVVDGNLFISAQADSDEQVGYRSATLAHLAAHEPQHIVQTLAALDTGDLAEAARGESPAVNDLLLPFAEAINEYQCDLAANRIIVEPFPHDDQSLSDDLHAFRAALSASVRLNDTDRHLACRTVLTAAKELVKSVGYAAAYRFHDGADRSAPDPLPEQWDRYLEGLWADLLDMFATIPAAGEATDIAALAQTVYAMTERALRWLEEIGVRYEVEVRGDEWLRSCWWSVAEPI
ncbi:hypothetical protein OG976_22975 [Mycobacterium sp. NBC_00419]|uniref:hypothetical protein n=1 Tax=Mycobacterium sp. NBC_00419 TaxID=2975989 RepID=UPI002E23EAC8